MENENNITTTDLKQQLKRVEEQVQKLNKLDSDRRESMKEELLLRRTADSAVKKIYLQLGFVVAIITIFALLGFSQFRNSLSESISNSLKAHIKERVDSGLKPTEKKLVTAWPLK